MAALIEDYGLIGDLQTAALVSRHGSIDWLCFPRFDSGACFASLLGDEENGRWELAPDAQVTRASRRYRQDTLVLETEFETADGTVRLIDFMPPRGEAPDVVRIVEGVKGTVAMRMSVSIRFDYGSIIPWVRRRDDGILAIAGPDALFLATPVELEGRNFHTVAEFDVREGERVPFVLTWYPSHHPPPERVDPEQALADTESFWQEWVDRLHARRPLPRAPRPFARHAQGPDLRPDRRDRRGSHDLAPRGTRRRPKLGLPLLLAARRDAHPPRARPRGVRGRGPGVAGLAPAGDRRPSRPAPDHVRTRRRAAPRPSSSSNGSTGTRGRVRCESATRHPTSSSSTCTARWLDALYHSRVAGLAPLPEAWALNRKLLEWLEEGWRQPDQGIWEVRGPRRHFTHSKVMAWVAFDRAVRSAEEFGHEGPVDRWKALRDEIHEEVCREGFDAGLGAFTQSYGSQRLDASALIMPLVGFLPADDVRVAGTVAAVERELVRDGFVERYRADDENIEVDGLPPGEGTFLPCSFWLAQVYALQGRLEEAEGLFERLLGLRNDLGLLSEEYDVSSSRLVGNFPQAFTHLALVDAALTLDEGWCRRADRPQADEPRSGTADMAG